LENNIGKLLQESVQYLCHFLDKFLPKLYDNWWKDSVLNILSSYQRQAIERKGVATLAELDLSVLLRIFDANWYRISEELNLPREGRHYVKEMKTIRNKWAHKSTEEFLSDDMYRDIDTLQRFAKLINADEEFIRELNDEKKSLMNIEQENNKNQPPKNIENSIESETEFSAGMVVTLKSDPEAKGAIIKVVPSKPENRYDVFIDGKTQTFYASQLQPEKKEEKKETKLSLAQFHAYLSALQIQHPGLSALYSLRAARIDFIPYQFRPVLKFIRSDRPRLLIADSVGVGKTIEAGLILQELQARRDIRSVLIICPRPLVIENKWQTEMKRFGEKFEAVDGPALRYCINETDLDGEWPEKYQKVITPYSLFDEFLLFGKSSKNKTRRKIHKGLLALDPPPRFDLVIVDEAHHIRNTNTYRHQAVDFFCRNAEAVLFLTATPIQLGNKDLFVLLNILRPDLIIDEESFGHMSEPNSFINQAVSYARSNDPQWPVKTQEALNKAADTPWGRSLLQSNPEFVEIRNQLQQDTPLSDTERIKLVKKIETLHTFSNVINRTLRRDIGDFTVRKPVTVETSFTPPQKKLYKDLLQIQAKILKRLRQNVSVRFMMTTIMRQAASCLYGLAPFLHDILNRHIDELTQMEMDNTGGFIEESVVQKIEEEIHDILNYARSLDPFDPKLEKLKKIVFDKQKLPNNKVMLFSSFRHTLQYIYDHLEKEGFRIGLVHGGTPDEERIEFRNRFRMDKNEEKALDVLLFSEIGCEGLDYQFCDCLVNYDLPWNPMRIEQRIGRIDRQGQKSEKVAIYNLITPETIDADIYYRCLIRIGIFERSLGASEEILGDINQEIKNIGTNFELTEEERQKKLQQLADNQIRLLQEQEELEQKQVDLFSIRIPGNQFKGEVEEASSFWLSPQALQNLVMVYLQLRCGKEKEFILGEKSLKTLRLSQEDRNILLSDFQKLPRQKTPFYREWEHWLKGGTPHLSVTFDTDCATDHTEAAFIMPLHPLAKQASNYFKIGEQRVMTLKIEDSELPAGDYPFMIYQWIFKGIREDVVLQPVTSNEVMTEHLTQLLEKAVEDSDNDHDDPSLWADLDAHHYKLWAAAREKHREKTKELAQYQKESLTTSHRARIALLNDLLAQATEENIRRMRRSQISSAEADYIRRVQELEIAMERADIAAQSVAYGVIYIDGGLSDAE